MRHDGNFRGPSPRRQPRTRSQTCRSLSCLPPWFMLRRRFNGGKTGDSRKLGKEKMEGKSDVTERKNGKMKGRSRNCEASSSSSSKGDDVINVPEAYNFNLGVGFGLIYIVRDELNKMVELRQNIEVLLEELRNQDKEPLSMPSKSSISSSLSNTVVQETSYPEENNSKQLSSYDVELLGTCFSSTRYRREKSLRMDQLEAELEAEFDRLQLLSDSFKYSKQQHSEVNVEDMSAPELSRNACYEEEDYEPHDEFYSVSPRELENKLHEVLETRQQEKIEELESALEYAMQQLEEKERELACWKEAARYVSQHFPQVTGMLRQGNEDVYCLETEVEGQSLVKCSVYGARAI
ncbi:protein polar localization during asymmetric division and redistribution [Phtheirospermum japonicum]|uniref:Protein polar localization during asymmetric division and redistribution n=1 Tax=Phtheirospermum japonicum TaxID=374723 RepID=A0A830CPU2_9LAMI|nr:protein polar localization during asymmetric division and redistribution [Phtheirospermum japonicum]